MAEIVSVRVRMAWWLPGVIWLLTPFGRLGLSAPDALLSWIAARAAKVEVV